MSCSHRLDALLLTAPELQLYPRAGNLPEPEGAGDAVADPSSDEELSTTDGEDTSDDADSDDLKWCPPNSNAQDDHRRKTGWGCRKLDTMMAKVQPSLNIFFTPDSCISQLLLRGLLNFSRLMRKAATLATPAGRLLVRGYSCSSGAVRRRASRQCVSKYCPIYILVA